MENFADFALIQERFGIENIKVQYRNTLRIKCFDVNKGIHKMIKKHFRYTARTVWYEGKLIGEYSVINNWMYLKMFVDELV